jgi:hypothetical protein
MIILVTQEFTAVLLRCSLEPLHWGIRITSLLSEDEMHFILIYFKSDSKDRHSNNAV